jgi:transcriptional antiterminator NusG
MDDKDPDMKEEVSDETPEEEVSDDVSGEESKDPLEKEVEDEMQEESREEREREEVLESAAEDKESDDEKSVEQKLEEKMEEEYTDTGNKEIPEVEVEEDESPEEKDEEKKEEAAEVEGDSKEEHSIDIDDDQYRWYAVRIISGHENKVKAYLDSEIRTEGYDDRIKNVLIPLEKVFEVKGGKKKIKYKNFLPGYILIQAELDDKIRNFISQAPSIINMVGSKSVQGAKLEPIPLKKAEVKRIAALLSEEAETEKIDLHLNVGDPVKVTSGPFNNFSGNVLEINTEKMKVKVMVSIFGRKTPIELEFTQIEKEK